MEEIKYRLEHGSASAVSAAMHKLTVRIASEAKETSAGSAEEKLLWEMVRSPKPFVASAAANAILKLVSTGVFTDATAISGLMAASAHAAIPGAVVSALGSILDMQSAVNAQVCGSTTKKKRAFGIASNAHPFVSLLRASPTFWPHVLGHCGQLCVPRGVDGARRAIDDLRPVFMFAFCDPHQHPHFAPLRNGLVVVIEDLFKMSNSELDLDGVLITLTKDILAWLSFHDAASLAENIATALKLLKLLDGPETREGAFLFLCSLLLRTAEFGLSTKVMLTELEKRLPDVTRPSTAGASLLLLAMTVDHSDDANLDQVVGLAHALAFGSESRRPPRLTVSAFLASVLPHLSHRTAIEASVYGQLRELSLASNAEADNTRESEHFGENMFSFDVHVASALEEQRLLHVLGQSDRNQVQWLRTVTNQGVIGVTRCLFRLVAAIAVASENEAQAVAAFDFLAKAAEKDTSLSHAVLALITHRLSKSEPLSLRLLKLLPTLASDKGCVGSVLQLVNSLAARPALLPLRLRLLYDLWTREPRVYPFLQRALEENPPEVFRLEFQMAKAKVIGDVCRRGADQHGADLLPLLSNLLNACTDATETTVCTLALGGILHLCQESVIDIRTTVGVLAPKLWQDERVEVVRKFIALLALPTAFASSNADYRAFCRQTVGILWRKATTLENKSLRRACLESLARYPLDDHELAFLPGYCKADLKFPAGFTPPTDGPVPRPEEVLDYIPGDCWMQLLQNCPEEEMPSYAKVVLALMTEEVAALPRGVYYVSSAMKHRAEEPANYGHLRETSLLRAAVALLQPAAAGKLKPAESVVCTIMEMLASASFNAERALPPLDWAFLEKLGAADSQPALAAFKLALSQCSSSRSAKFYVRPVLFGKSGQESRIDATFRCLSQVTSAFDSEEVAAFARDVFGDLSARISCDANNTALRDRFVELMRCAAADKKAHSETLLGSLKEAMEAIPLGEEELFEGALEVTSSAFPKLLLSLEDSEKSEFALRRSLSLRVHLASAGLVEDPLHLLVCCVDAAAAERRLHGEVLHAVMVVASKTRSDISWHQSNKQWLLELMGHIRSVSRRRQPDGDADFVRLLLDTFAVAVVVLSGTDLLVQPREKICGLGERPLLLHLLPVAVGRLMLLPSPPWRALAPLLSEWMLHVVADETTPLDHASAIKRCFSAFKRGDDYTEASVWSRLVPYHSSGQ